MSAAMTITFLSAKSSQIGRGRARFQQARSRFPAPSMGSATTDNLPRQRWISDSAACGTELLLFKDAHLPRIIAHALCCLGLMAATPAVAQDSDPVGQLVEGYVACLVGDGDAGLVAELFNDNGWSAEPGADGLIGFQPASGDATFAYVADDGSFCHVESTVVDSASASEILAITLERADEVDITYEKDAMGCTVLRLADGRSATITSGGNDPTCGSDTDSGVRFATE
jgi:hypothetical protein